MAKLAGRVTIKADGQTFLTVQKSSTLTYGTKRTPVIGPNGPNGFTEEIINPMVSTKISAANGVNADDIDAIDDASLLFTADNGVQFVLSGAYSMEGIKYSESEGAYDTSFGAMTCRQVGGI